MSVSGRKVYSISDGDGDDFNDNVSTKTIINWFESWRVRWEIYLPSFKRRGSLHFDFSAPYGGGNGLDGSTILKTLKTDVLSIRAKTAKEWIEAASEAISKREKDWALPKQGAEAKGKVEFGCKLNLDKNCSVKSGEAFFGIGVDMGAASSFVKVSYEQSNKVTLKF